MPSDLPLELPPVKPWEERSNGVLPLAGGNELYLDALTWIVETCRTNRLSKIQLKERYRQQYGSSQKTAGSQIDAVFKYGLLRETASGVAPTAPVIRWSESRQAEFVIIAMHANVKLIGELLDAIRAPQSKETLRQYANDRYGFTWEKTAQIDFRLGWLRSAGMAQMLAGWQYEATEAGIALLERIELCPPSASPQEPPGDPTPESIPGTAQGDSGDAREFDDVAERSGQTTVHDTSSHRRTHCLAAEIGDRLVSLSCEGSKHQEFEAAVRDAFEFLGFDAELKSGSGQTDVLISGICKTTASDDAPAASRRFMAVVEVKAVGDGRLTSNQVNLSTVKKHRDSHGAEYALVVGPGPAGQLLSYARDEGIGVLDSERLAEIVRAQAEVPLPARDYGSLFADSRGQPQGGTVDLRPLEAARGEHEELRELLLGVFRAVSEIDGSNAGTAIAPVVQFALNRDGISAPLEEVEAALNLLATPWLDGLDLAGSGSHRYFVPTTTLQLLAQRLRWLGDAFDEAADDESESSEAS